VAWHEVSEGLGLLLEGARDGPRGKRKGPCLLWEVDSSLEQQEFYYGYLLYRPFGFVGTPGREEFIMDKTGLIEFRQVLEEPLPEAQPAAEGQ
jgi:hypothetical protein